MNLINIALSWFVPLMLAWSILSIFYWCLARRVFYDAIHYRIFRKRDELRALAISGNTDPNSFEYIFLENRLCLTLYSSGNITIFNIIRFCLSDESKKPSPELDHFINVASNDLVNLWKSAMRDIKFMMLVNSPIIAVVGTVTLFIKNINILITNEINKFFELKIVKDEANMDLIRA